MTIIRVEKKDNYSILPNAAINDKRLSLEARGLLVFLLSKPNDWQVNSRALTNISPAGRDKIRRILRELEQFGYLERRRFQGPDGKFVWESVVREEPLPATDTTEAEKDETENPPAPLPPEPEPETMVGFPVHGKPETMDGFSVDGLAVDGLAVDGLAVDGKPVPLINTDLINTDLTNTEQLNTRLSKATTTARLTRVPLGDNAAVAVVAVADLPAEVRQALKNLGWVGDTAEIARAWAENPGRVRAWLDYARRKGWSAALLRHTLRTDPGMPPQERPLAGWEAFAENFADADAPPPVTDGALAETEQEAPAPQPADRTPPDVGAPPPVAENATPDMGVEPPVPPPRAPDIGSDAASVPPDVRQWWQTAVGQVRYEMPKASFDTWVAPARPVRWREGDGNGEAYLTVAVANDYARRWLEERVAKILSRYVSALAGRPVTLEVTVG